VTPLTLLILQQSEKSRWQTGKKSAAFFKIILDISNQGVIIKTSSIEDKHESLALRQLRFRH